MNNLKFKVLAKYPNAKIYSKLGKWKVSTYNDGELYESSYKDSIDEAWADFHDKFVASYEECVDYNLFKKQTITLFLFILAAAILLAIFASPAKAQYRTKILNRYEYKQKFPAYQDGTRYQPKPRYSYKNKVRKK